MKCFRVICLVAGVGGALTVGLGATAPARLTPDVSLQLSDGSVVRPADYKGKVLLVDFWASWCVPCRASFPALDAMYQSHKDQGFAVLAVNVDEVRNNANAFLAQHPHHMPIVFDPKGDAPLAFAISGMPSSVLIDRSGRIRFTHMGYSTKILEIYRREVDQLLAEQP